MEKTPFRLARFSDFASAVLAVNVTLRRAKYGAPLTAPGSRHIPQIAFKTGQVWQLFDVPQVMQCSA